MPLFTKSLKIRSFTNKRVGRYLLYALGEIVLVVAGILIALQINNYNEERKQKKLVDGVLNSITYDLELDTLTVGAAIRYYEARDSVAKAIIDTSIVGRTLRNAPYVLHLYQPMSL